MHCWSVPEHRAKRPSRPLWRAGLALVLLLVALPPAIAAPVFEVHEARTRLAKGVYLLDARADIALDADTIEALQSGVPLTIIVEMEVLRERAVVNERIARVTARYRLEVHALSGQYVVTDLAIGASRSFRSYDRAIEHLGHLRDFPLFDAALLQDDQRYVLRIRARLDIEALPSPMRLVAYFDSLWRLPGSWSDWELEP